MIIPRLFPQILFYDEMPILYVDISKNNILLRKIKFLRSNVK